MLFSIYHHKRDVCVFVFLSLIAVTRKLFIGYDVIVILLMSGTYILLLLWYFGFSLRKNSTGKPQNDTPHSGFVFVVSVRQKNAIEPPLKSMTSLTYIHLQI